MNQKYSMTNDKVNKAVKELMDLYLNKDQRDSYGAEEKAK